MAGAPVIPRLRAIRFRRPAAKPAARYHIQVANGGADAMSQQRPTAEDHEIVRIQSEGGQSADEGMLVQGSYGIAHRLPRRVCGQAGEEAALVSAGSGGCPHGSSLLARAALSSRLQARMISGRSGGLALGWRPAKGPAGRAVHGRHCGV